MPTTVTVRDTCTERHCERRVFAPARESGCPVLLRMAAQAALCCTSPCFTVVRVAARLMLDGDVVDLVVGKDCSHDAHSQT